MATPEQVGARVPPCFPRMRAGTHGGQAWVLYTPTPTHLEALEPEGAIQVQRGNRACRGGQPQLPSLLRTQVLTTPGGARRSAGSGSQVPTCAWDNGLQLPSVDGDSNSGRTPGAAPDPGEQPVTGGQLPKEDPQG